MRSGSVRSCPRQLPPHLEMTLVHCSRDFSTLRSLYPRQYWSLTTEGGAARNSYKCKYICCCVILVLLCLLLSPVLAFLYHLFPFSFVRRSLSSSSVCLLFPVCWPVPYVSCSGYGLVPVLSVSCSISFLVRSIRISFFVLWLSILLKFIWYGHHPPRHVLVASYRPPFVLIRPHIRIRATLLRIAASAKLSHVILRLVNQPPRPALTRCRRLITLRFRCLPPRYSWSLVRHNHKLRPPPHHNEGAAPDVLTFEFLDPFAIKLTLLAVRYLQFPFSCHPLTRRRQLSSL